MVAQFFSLMCDSHNQRLAACLSIDIWHVVNSLFCISFVLFLCIQKIGSVPKSGLGINAFHLVNFCIEQSWCKSLCVYFFTNFEGTYRKITNWFYFTSGDALAITYLQNASYCIMQVYCVIFGSASTHFSHLQRCK